MGKIQCLSRVISWSLIKYYMNFKWKFIIPPFFFQNSLHSNLPKPQIKSHWFKRKLVSWIKSWNKVLENKEKRINGRSTNANKMELTLTILVYTCNEKQYFNCQNW